MTRSKPQPAASTQHAPASPPEPSPDSKPSSRSQLTSSEPNTPTDLPPLSSTPQPDKPDELERDERGDLRGEATPARHRTGLAAPWKPGQSGNPAGRPKGARSRLSEDFLRTLADDFKAHGKAAVEKVRAKKPHLYLRIIADLMPREAKIEIEHLEQLQSPREILSVILDECGIEAAEAMATAFGLPFDAEDHVLDVTPELAPAEPDFLPARKR